MHEAPNGAGVTIDADSEVYQPEVEALTTIRGDDLAAIEFAGRHYVACAFSFS